MGCQGLYKRSAYFSGAVGHSAILTLAVVTIGIAAVPVVAFILVVLVAVVTVTVPMVSASVLSGAADVGLPTGDQGSGNGRECRGGRGRSRGRGRGGHPCEESSRGHGVDWETDDEENEEGGARYGRHHAHGRGLSRTAKMPKGGCEPTMKTRRKLLRQQSRERRGTVPQSSRDRHGRCACCASHGRRLLRRDDPHTRQMRSWQFVSVGGGCLRIIRAMGMLTVCCSQSEAPECRNGQACHSCVKLSASPIKSNRLEAGLRPGGLVVPPELTELSTAFWGSVDRRLARCKATRAHRLIGNIRPFI